MKGTESAADLSCALLERPELIVCLGGRQFFLRGDNVFFGVVCMIGVPADPVGVTFEIRS